MGQAKLRVFLMACMIAWAGTADAQERYAVWMKWTRNSVTVSVGAHERLFTEIAVADRQHLASAITRQAAGQFGFEGSNCRKANEIPNNDDLLCTRRERDRYYLTAKISTLQETEPGSWRVKVDLSASEGTDTRPMAMDAFGARVFARAWGEGEREKAQWEWRGTMSWSDNPEPVTWNGTEKGSLYSALARHYEKQGCQWSEYTTLGTVPGGYYGYNAKARCGAIELKWVYGEAPAGRPEGYRANGRMREYQDGKVSRQGSFSVFKVPNVTWSPSGFW